MLNSCFQYLVKKYKPGQKKETYNFMKLKCYNKTLDYMQKKVTG